MTQQSKHKIVRLLILTGVIAGLTSGILWALNIQTPKFLGREGVILQKDKNDCGIAAVRNVLQTFGESDAGLDTLLCATESGVNLLEIKKALLAKGLLTTGYKTTLGELSNLPMPMIAHFNKNHFVVIESVRESELTIIDPAVGKLNYPKKAFEAKWDGIILCVEGLERKN
jgi:ABC-type bacteriocin/lantibiotic exporter with double-glycine peptidase domain